MQPVRVSCVSSRFCVFLLSGLSLFSVSGLYGTVDVDQSWSPSLTGCTEQVLQEGDQAAQTFVAGMTGLLDSVEIIAASTNGAGSTVQLHIFRIQEPSPLELLPENLLFTAPLDGGLFSSTAGPMHVDVRDAGILLQEGERLAVAVSAQGPGVCWCFGEGYPAGEGFVKTAADSAWSERGGDFGFRTYMQRFNVSRTTFLRGDANASGITDIADAVFTLYWLFSDGERPSCDDAADTNDDGAIDISDVVTTLRYLFVPEVTELEAPSQVCGTDPTSDALTCLSFQPCTTNNLTITDVTLLTEASQLFMAHPFRAQVTFSVDEPAEDVAISFSIISAAGASENEAREQYKVGVSAGQAQAGLNTREVELLAPGGEATPGDYNLTAFIDPSDVIEETNEDDNVFAADMVLSEFSDAHVDTPNMTVKNLAFDPQVISVNLSRPRPIIFFGEDLNFSGDNTPLTLEQRPKTTASQAAFAANLASVFFEGPQDASLFRFFNLLEMQVVRCYLEGGCHCLSFELGGGVHFSAPGGSGPCQGMFSWGGYPTSETFSIDIGSGVTFTFQQPAVAFGFNATDAGDAEGLEGIRSRLRVTLFHDDGGESVLRVPHATSVTAGQSINASALHFGVLYPERPFRKVLVDVEFDPDQESVPPEDFLERIALDEIICAGEVVEDLFVPPEQIRTTEFDTQLGAILDVSATGGLPPGTKDDPPGVLVPVAVGIEVQVMDELITMDRLPLWIPDQAYNLFQEINFDTDLFDITGQVSDAINDSSFMQEAAITITPGEEKRIYTPLSIPLNLEALIVRKLREIPDLPPLLELTAHVTVRLDPDDVIAELEPSPKTDNIITADLKINVFEVPPPCDHEVRFDRTFDNSYFGAAVHFASGVRLDGQGAWGSIDGSLPVTVFNRTVEFAGFELAAHRNPCREFSEFAMDLTFLDQTVYTCVFDSCMPDTGDLSIHLISEGAYSSFKFSKGPDGGALEKSWSKEFLGKCKTFFPGGVPITVSGSVGGSIGFRAELQNSDEFFIRGGPFAGLSGDVSAALGIKDCEFGTGADFQFVGATAWLNIIKDYFAPELYCSMRCLEPDAVLPERIEGEMSLGFVNILTSLDGRVYAWVRYPCFSICWKWGWLPYPCRFRWCRAEIDIVKWKGFEEKWPKIPSLLKCTTWQPSEETGDPCAGR